MADLTFTGLDTDAAHDLIAQLTARLRQVKVDHPA